MPAPIPNPFKTLDTITTAAGAVKVHRLDRLAAAGVGPIDRLPFSIRVLLENMLRHCDGRIAKESRGTSFGVCGKSSQGRGKSFSARGKSPCRTIPCNDCAARAWQRNGRRHGTWPMT